MKNTRLQFGIAIITGLLLVGCGDGRSANVMYDEDIVSDEEITGASEVTINYKTAEKTFARDVIAISEQEKEQQLNELYESLKEIHGLSSRNISDLKIRENYICYGDTLILDGIIYQKEEGKYVKQESTLNSIFDIADELAMKYMQYKNLIITVAKDKKAWC